MKIMILNFKIKQKSKTTLGKIKNLVLDFILELSFMTLKGDAKFEGKLTCEL